MSTAFAELDSVIIICVLLLCSLKNARGLFSSLFTQISAGEIQLFTTLLFFFQAIYAVAVRIKTTMPVIPSNYRLVSVQRASLETVPPPRDRLSLGGQSELISWWFIPDHIHGTSSSILFSRSAIAVTLH